MALDTPTERKSAAAGHSAKRGGLRNLTWRGQTLLVLVPTLIGILLGVALPVLPAQSYRALVLVDAGPGSSAADSLTFSPDVSNRFVQTELVYLDIEDPQIKAAITSATGIANPAPVATRQIGSTNVVEIAATAPTADLSAKAAKAAADVYVAGWRDRASADLDRSLAAIQQRLAQIQTQLKALPATGGTSAQVAERDALSAEVGRLTGLQATASFDRTSIATSDRIVAAADPATATKSTSLTRNIALGGLVGLIVGLGALMLVRRRDATEALGDG